MLTVCPNLMALPKADSPPCLSLRFASQERSAFTDGPFHPADTFAVRVTHPAPSLHPSKLERDNRKQCMKLEWLKRKEKHVIKDILKTGSEICI